MPELPDVEVFKRYLDSTSLHQDIQKVEVENTRILKNISARQLQTRLKGRRFDRTSRHGKYLFVHLDDGQYLTLHFGMTGFPRYFKNDEKEPDHERVKVKFKNGYQLAYDNQRLLGTVKMIRDRNRFINTNRLGPDALAPDFDFDAFQECLEGRRGMIKSALMNQEIIAGIGNVYSDEILFQAGIHPKTSVGSLDTSALLSLYHAMKHVLQRSIKANADPEKMPAGFLIPQRHKGGVCPNCDTPVEKIKVAGRSGYFCPACQQRSED